jgi:hypothetical protein
VLEHPEQVRRPAFEEDRVERQQGPQAVAIVALQRRTFIDQQR